MPLLPEAPEAVVAVETVVLAAVVVVSVDEALLSSLTGCSWLAGGGPNSPHATMHVLPTVSTCARVARRCTRAKRSAVSWRASGTALGSHWVG